MAIFRKNKREFAHHSKRNYFVALFLFLVFGVSGIIALLLKANAQLVPVESVDIYSQHSNYQNREPGSWNVTKTAEWTDLGKARITFELHSVPKVNYSKKLDCVRDLDN